MRPLRLSASLVLAALTCLMGGMSAQRPAFDSLLSRYSAGQFDQVIAELGSLRNLDDLLSHLKEHGPAWIAAGGEQERARRELAAASFALEAARTRAWDEWKWVQVQPALSVPGVPGSYQPLDLLYWRAPPLLIEWGCSVMRARTDRLEAANPTPAGPRSQANAWSPPAIERWWQLAALSVAQRSEDFQFLVGNPFGQELGNPKVEIEHLNHVLPRFKDEPRFTLAQGIAVEWRWGSQALAVFDALKDDTAVGAEARMRTGAVFLRAGRREVALKLFDEVESQTRRSLRHLPGAPPHGPSAGTRQRIRGGRTRVSSGRGHSAERAVGLDDAGGGAVPDRSPLRSAAHRRRDAPRAAAARQSMAHVHPRRRSVLAAAHRTRARGRPPMMRTVVSIGVAIALWPGPNRSEFARQTTAPQAQTFRTTTDVVTVDVSVRVDGRAVPGLTAKDFVLLDNGVKQRIDAAEAAEVPIDLTIIVDVSGEPYGNWDSRTELPKIRADLDAELRTVARLMRAADRIRVLGVETYATEIVPLQAPATVGPIREVSAGGLASLYDTLVSALVQPVEPGRRHIVLARTKGNDTISVVDANVVRDVAARSDAVLHIVGMSTAFLNENERRGFQCVQIGLCQPTRRFWQPFRHVSFLPDGLSLTPAGNALAQAARATGGAFHVAELLAEPTLTSTFKRVLDDFRRSYVLQYTPQGIRRDGWHEINVTGPGTPNAVVQSKRGYAVEPAVEPVRTRRSADGATVTLDDLVTAYEKGDYLVMRQGLARATDTARLIRELRESGNPWPALPRREAVFVLELAETGLFSSRLADRDAAAALLGAFHRFDQASVGAGCLRALLALGRAGDRAGHGAERFRATAGRARVVALSR